MIFSSFYNVQKDTLTDTLFVNNESITHKKSPSFLKDFPS